MRETDAGQYGALDRKAIMDANLSLMMAGGLAVVADHAFTTGKIAQTGFEKPLRSKPAKKVGIVNGFGCFPEKVSAAKNTGSFILDDFEHEIGTNFVVRGKGLVVLTSCSHRGGHQYDQAGASRFRHPEGTCDHRRFPHRAATD